MEKVIKEAIITNFFIVVIQMMIESTKLRGLATVYITYLSANIADITDRG